jgi:hypothetical protein
MMRRRLKDWDSLKAAAVMHEPDPVQNAKMQLVDEICAKLEDVNTFSLLFQYPIALQFSRSSDSIAVSLDSFLSFKWS